MDHRPKNSFSMSYASRKVIFPGDDYIHIIYHKPVQFILFLMQQPAFKEHMSYAPAKKFNGSAERIYSEVKSSDWWWNE
jgi:hypothetical protein